MMKYLGLIVGWFVVAVVLIVLLVVVAIVPFGGLTAGMLGKVFGVWLVLGILGAALMGVYAYFRVKRVVKGLTDMVEDLTQRSGVYSYLPEIKVAERHQSQRLAEDSRAAQLHREMLDAGFTHEGDFVFDEWGGLVFAGYVHVEKSVYGVVNHLPGKWTWAEVKGHFENGESLLVSGLMQPDYLDPRPTATRISEPGAGVAELLTLYEKNKPEAKGMEIKAGTFKQNMEVYWWVDNLWRHKRGGLTLEEVTRMVCAEREGKAEVISQMQFQRVHIAENLNWAKAWTQVPGELIDRHLSSAGVNEENEAYLDRQIRLVAAFEGQTLDEFQEYLAERLHNLHEQVQAERGRDDSETTQSFKPSTFRPGADGYKLAAAAEGEADGLTGAAAIARKYPEWFKEVYAGEHPMRYTIYEVNQT